MRTNFLNRLQSGDVLVLDGATGSELQRRGVYVSHGSTDSLLGPWSATANLDAPDVVRAVHEDYLRLGVDILTSNNFWTSRSRLAVAGLGDRWEEYARAAGEIAVAARDAVNPDAYVAGGIAPPLRDEEDVAQTFREHASLLGGLGVDLILAEYVRDVGDAVAAVEGSADSGLPIVLGMCHVMTERGELLSGETFADLARALDGRPVAAILLMCSPPEDISAGLPKLRAAFDGAVGGYANVGYERNPKFGETEGEHWHQINEEKQTVYNPAAYADFAREWIDMGAQIVGGCCATRPEHIAAIVPAVHTT
jgi:S-methylmethionine-dependent homocysteine/selenocysteine methylase